MASAALSAEQKAKQAVKRSAIGSTEIQWDRDIGRASKEGRCVHGFSVQRFRVYDATSNPKILTSLEDRVTARYLETWVEL
jgi:hypothetical protein